MAKIKNYPRIVMWLAMLSSCMVVKPIEQHEHIALLDGSQVRGISFEPGSAHSYEAFDSYQVWAEMIAHKLDLSMPEFGNLMVESLIPLIVGGRLFYRFSDSLMPHLPAGYDDNYQPSEPPFRGREFSAGFGVITDVRSHAKLLAAMMEWRGLSTQNQYNLRLPQTQVALTHNS